MGIQKKVILIAEDDSVIRELLTAMLKTSGYELITATDGIEAVDAFRNHGEKVHLVITDIGMPRMNGMEAIQEIRKLSASVPIMILSIWEEKEYRRIAEENHVKEYMKKPFDVNELILKVRQLLPDVPPEAQSSAT